jgi:23S rRNA (uridine2552-2'-O)-methyltransferase
LGRRSSDHYTRRARERAYPARSVFKLEEMDRRTGLLAKGDRVLDLGCSPGSWLKYAARRVGRTGLVIGVDLAPPSIPLPPNARFVQADVLTLTPGDVDCQPSTLSVVLSDMAPSTSGTALVDQERSFELFDRARVLALELLAPGGKFAAKLFFSPRHQEAVTALRPSFSRVRTLRPRATRSSSREVFVVGLGYSGSTDRSRP